MASLKLLTAEELKKMTKEERIEYYSMLYRKLKDTDKYYEQNKNFLKNKLNDLVRVILKTTTPYEFYIDGVENIYGTEGPFIFASSHQDFYDAMNTIYSAPTPVNILSNKNINAKEKMLLSMNGATFVDRNNRESRNASKEILTQSLENGYSVNVYPEGTFNLSPNKLHLPYWAGIIDAAQKTGKPVIPVIQEYKYGYNKKGRIEVKKVYIRFGEPLYVKKEDVILEKLAEFDEIMSTMAWELMEIDADNKDLLNEDAVFELKRSEIDEQFYADVIDRKIETIEKSGNTIEEEEEAIFRPKDDDFFQYFYINANPTIGNSKLSGRGRR